MGADMYLSRPDGGEKQRKPTFFELEVNLVRKAIKRTASDLLHLRDAVRTGNHLAPPPDEAAARQLAVEDRGEMIANLQLAYRHLEDASMRLGKAIQASDGGTSVYDRESTVGA